MNNAYNFVLFLSLAFFSGQLVVAQHHDPSSAACESEVANLKEQIRRIILDSQETLEESDNKLMAALQRINALEAENERLTESRYSEEQTKRNQNKRLAVKLSEAEAQTARLTDENMALQKQLESLQRNGQDNEYNFTSALESARHADRSQIRQQKEAYRLMESNLDHAYKEMVLLKAELRASQAENESLKKDNVEVRRLADTQKKTYEKQLVTTRNELQREETSSMRVQGNSLACRQIVDSLKFELSSMQRMVDILNHAEQVDQNRISRIETNEKGLSELKFKLEIREQLLFAREKDMNQRQKELELKEEKLVHLQEKEKELKLLEQRLRHYASPQGTPASTSSRGN
jgi:hypothetical protein